jgi:hypothetical protein
MIMMNRDALETLGMAEIPEIDHPLLLDITVYMHENGAEGDGCRFTIT